VAFHRQNYFQRRTNPRGTKTNERIRAPQVQVIDSDGKNLGILVTHEAINIAKQEGLDLIEIAPNAKPPVCKIIDMGKYKYDAQKKANKAKKKQKKIELKEIKLRPVLKLELEICLRHFGFHPYRSSIKRSFCKAPSGHACKGC